MNASSARSARPTQRPVLLAAAATAAWLLLPVQPSADAAVVYRPAAAFDVVHFTASLTTFAVDLDGDGTDDAGFEGYNGRIEALDGDVAEGPFFQSIRLFQPGDVIPFDHGFASSLYADLTQFSQPRFIGVRFYDFDLPDPVGRLGYFSLAYDRASDTLHVANFAYESVEGANLAVAVPEPTSLAALAVGAAGLLRRGRRA